MTNFLRWFLINLGLPLSPFLVRIFVTFVGKEQKFSWEKIAELPEIVFYSIFVCVIILNINLNGKKKLFETVIRLFLGVIISLDFLTLGMIYSNNFGPTTFRFSIIAAIIPSIIAPIYKFYYISNSKESQKKC